MIKRTFTTLLVLLLILLGVLVFRAQTHFTDQQLAVETSQSELSIPLNDAVKRLAVALSYPTISHDDPDELDEAAFLGLREHMQSSFPTVHAQGRPRLFNGHSLLFEFRGAEPELKPALFMGHIDVVPVDSATLDDWSFPPFGGAVEDNVIWGRGAMDDKVTVFALMEAMESLLASGLKPQRTLYFAFGHDEEIGGPKGAAAIAAYFRDLGVEFEYVLDEGGVITEGLMSGVDAPVAVIGIAEKGFVNLRLSVRAKGGHSSQPPAHTAAGILSQAIVKLEDSPFSSDLGYSKMTLDYVGDRMPFTTRLMMSNLWLFEPLVARVMERTSSTAAGIRTTIAATMLEGSSKSNILPTLATAVVNVRIMPGDSVASVYKHFEDAIDDPRVELSTFMANEPSAVSPTDSLGYRLIAKHIRAMDSSILVAPYLVAGGTDSKHFYGLSSNIYRFIMVRATAKSLDQIHGINEQLPVADYETAIRFFANLLDATAEG